MKVFKTKKEIIHLALKTGYTFKNVYGHISKTVEKENGSVGIADSANTFAHYYLEKEVKGKPIKPIYGVRLTVVDDATEKVKPRGQFGYEYIFIAKNYSGLKEIYSLIKIHYENFYYRGNISFKDVYSLSENVIVIAENTKYLRRLDYIALTTTTPNFIYELDLPKVAIVNNFYPDEKDFDTYELFVGHRNSCLQTYPQHILTTEEYINFQTEKGFGQFTEEAINNTHAIAEQCEHIKLEQAPIIKFDSKKTIEELCIEGAKEKGIDIFSDGIYKDRYERELKLIKEKEFDDYFLVVADMIAKAKKKMLVGASRGSSAGSLVCYLLHITEVEPIKYGLLFERFIDINRSDLPDIDIDFPDVKRKEVIKQLEKDFGKDKVKHIANVSTMKPKISINEFSKELKIPISETENVKNSVIERSAGDARINSCIEDTFKETQTGKDFVLKYPAMMLASEVENHPRHSSVHAAGIIVCNEPIHKYCGVNPRDNVVMLDKKGAEYLNLLKIDVLGLRTLSVLQDCGTQVGMNNKDFYEMELEDEKTFEIFNTMRLSGIFQFEGDAVGGLTKKMGIKNFNDIVALTSLARPASLQSGGAHKYVKYRLNQEEPIYYGKEHKKITEETFSIVVYQEQILNICRGVAGMNWEDVNALRKAFSKSLGKEYFSTYEQKFIEGALKNNYSKENADLMWNDLVHSGNYAFNKSHAVAYALISYWTAYMKAHYPLEFAVANLNHAKSDDAALKILRDVVENQKMKYVAVDKDHSLKKWSVTNGIIYGGLTNIKGIADKTANKIINSRTGQEKLTPSIIEKLENPVTPFDYLYPCKHFWGDIYKNFSEYGLIEEPSLIEDIQETGDYVFIGQLKEKNVKDLNEALYVKRRKGKILKDNTLQLSLKIEDDSDSIMGSVDRFNFERIGKQVAKFAEVDEDWFIFHGTISGEYRFIKLKNIIKLEESFIINK
jgi:DNA polymerase III alpha subunit